MRLAICIFNHVMVNFPVRSDRMHGDNTTFSLLYNRAKGGVIHRTRVPAEFADYFASRRVPNTGCIVVGLPDAAVQESRKRVQAAIRKAGFDFPQYRTQC
jgi:hypothetical protein